MHKYLILLGLVTLLFVGAFAEETEEGEGGAEEGEGAEGEPDAKQLSQECLTACTPKDAPTTGENDDLTQEACDSLRTFHKCLSGGTTEGKACDNEADKAAFEDFKETADAKAAADACDKEFPASGSNYIKQSMLVTLAFVYGAIKLM